jgi:hypothetical protein
VLESPRLAADQVVVDTRQRDCRAREAHGKHAETLISRSAAHREVADGHGGECGSQTVGSDGEQDDLTRNHVDHLACGGPHDIGRRQRSHLAHDVVTNVA